MTIEDTTPLPTTPQWHQSNFASSDKKNKTQTKLGSAIARLLLPRSLFTSWHPTQAPLRRVDKGQLNQPPVIPLLQE